MQEIFSSKERSTRLDRGDKRLMWALTLIYMVFTLLNLGTLSFPTSVWTAQSGAAVRIDLGAEYDVVEIWTNGNIAEGSAVFTGDDGSTAEYTQKYATMFTWRTQTAAMHTRYITLQCTAGKVSLNEIAFFDAAGNRLPAVIAAGTTEGAALLDEPDTVPDEPSYLNGMYFDEIYHARTSYEFLHTMSVYEWTHPPLGKILIMLGVVLFGMKPFGWRVVPALFGAAMLPVFFTLAKRLFRRRDLAFLAAALLALDTMHFTQTRIATVDVFILFFILLDGSVHDRLYPDGLHERAAQKALSSARRVRRKLRSRRGIQMDGSVRRSRSRRDVLRAHDTRRYFLPEGYCGAQGVLAQDMGDGRFLLRVLPRDPGAYLLSFVYSVFPL